MARPKGQPKLGGRKKGTENKTTATLKQMIIAAMDEVGGKDYLVKISESDPKAFLAFVGKIIPTEIQADIKEVIDSTDEEKLAEYNRLKKKYDDE